MSFLIHSANPQSRPVGVIVVIVFAQCPSVNTFKNIAKQSEKQCSPLARMWAWPSGSLMTPPHVLFKPIVVHNNISTFRNTKHQIKGIRRVQAWLAITPAFHIVTVTGGFMEALPLACILLTKLGLSMIHLASP